MAADQKTEEPNPAQDIAARVAQSAAMICECMGSAPMKFSDQTGCYAAAGASVGSVVAPSDSSAELLALAMK